MKRVIFAMLLVSGIAAAQAPAFEVASIKLRSGDITWMSDPSVRGSRVAGTALTLVDLLTWAYDVRYEQIEAPPKWAQAEHYDVNAKAPGDTPPSKEQARQMMQRLLAERFHLRIHREKKELSVYALVVGRSGHKLTASTADAKSPNLTTASSRGMLMEVSGGTMENLARQLAHSAGRPVIDRTGLGGYWAYKLEWIPIAGAADAAVDAPSMFTAIQEQLGLRLEPSKAPFDMLVIDHAERPSEN